MKIKELFEKIETANEVAKIFNEKYVLQFTTNTGIFPAEFSKYDEFAEFVKDEYRETWANPLLADFYISTIPTKETNLSRYYLRMLSHSTKKIVFPFISRS